MEHANLSSYIRLDLQRLVILPRDVKPARNPHDARCTISFALLSSRLILRRIPGVGHFTALWVQRYSCIVALVWKHAPSPVLVDHRNPIAGHIKGSCGLRCRGSGATSASRSLGMRSESRRQNKERHKKETAH